MPRKVDPFPYVGGYSLDVYCDQEDCGASGGYWGQTLGEAKADARRFGWVFHRDRTTTCGQH